MLLDGSAGEESVCNARDLGSFSGLGRSPGDGNGDPLQYSCLENLMNRGVWWATVSGVIKSRTGMSPKLSIAQHRSSLNDTSGLN